MNNTFIYYNFDNIIENPELNFINKRNFFIINDVDNPEIIYIGPYIIINLLLYIIKIFLNFF
jgi:hypothetical protein